MGDSVPMSASEILPLATWQVICLALIPFVWTLFILAAREVFEATIGWAITLPGFLILAAAVVLA